jgi:4-hydroxy-3-methylbut-2-en-1-yl diphosphate reductase
MSAAARAAAAGATAGEGRLLAVAALRMERAAVRRSLPGALVLRCGMGAAQARAAVPLVARAPGDAVAVVGFCGAARQGLRAGDVVVASEVRGPEGVIACSSGPLVAALAALGIERVHVGPIASADHVVRGAERDLLARQGVLAVDMESAWLASGAAGRPFAVLRVVVDTPERELTRPLATLTGTLDAWRALRRAAPALSAWAQATGPRALLLARPRSFCAGARRAIEIVERALERYGAPVFVRKQIVHNVHVTNDLQRRGAVFVDDLDDVPRGALCVFSAHGVSPLVREQAVERELRVIDATCPLVTRVHSKTRHLAADGYSIVLLGHRGHDEIEGTMGEAPQAIKLVDGIAEIDRLELDPHDRIAYLTQTTLAVDEVADTVAALRRRYPNLEGPDAHGICYATSNRQEAVKELARESDLMVVIGSSNSSNSLRLVEVAEREGCRALLADDERGLDPALLVGARTVGITAGASAPDALVRRVVAAFAGLGPVTVEERGDAGETMEFSLPRGLRREQTGGQVDADAGLAADAALAAEAALAADAALAAEAALAIERSTPGV